MPFTPVHAAAALPFQRTRLIPSALVIGCMAPDFEYYIRFGAEGHFGHTLLGAFALDLPLALLALLIFHRYAKEPLWTWLPRSVRERVEPGPRNFSLGGGRRVALVVASILIGIATHILWDSVTHSTYWPYRHWRFMRQAAPLPFARAIQPYVGTIQYYKLFQIGSDVVGTLVLVIWFVLWYRAAVPVGSSRAGATGNEPRGENNWGVLWLVIAAALIGALIRAFATVGIPTKRHQAVLFFAQAVINGISIFWIGVVGYGVIRARRCGQAKEAVT